MTENVNTKAEALPDLDDLLQCPVCYEIPSGQIFQCNEGHHVCGRCKMRLDVCPVCRAFFFGTRNYAMEELISNIRKLRAFKLGGKVTTGNVVEAPVERTESPTEENESVDNNNDEEDDDVSSRTSVQPPRSCRGLFRCLCCKNNPERLPAARLLNHLRYFHAPDLIEGRSENSEYLQAWQFSTTPGRIVTAVRVADMGIFFLIIEITDESVHAWLSMASSPWVAHEYSYTLTLSGNDREAIFTDCVWSVRSCEGSLKKRGRCLTVTGSDGRALLAPTAMNGKLSVRRTPVELLPQITQPRAVLRVANRSNVRDAATNDLVHQNIEPFLQDLQNDVDRLSRVFATLGREADALVRSEAGIHVRIENIINRQNSTTSGRSAAPENPETLPSAQNGEPETADRTHLSRNARRRMRQRLRAAFRETQASDDNSSVSSHRHNTDQENVARNNAQTVGSAPQTNNAQSASGNRNNNDNSVLRTQSHVLGNTSRSINSGRSNGNRNSSNPQVNDTVENITVFSGFAVVQNASPPPESAPAPAAGGGASHVNVNASRNKKKRRHRR